MKTLTSITETRAVPVVKWPGGKRRLVGRITGEFPDPPINTYWEPFAGGAAVFFAVADRALHCVLTDTNRRLIHTYRALAEDCDAVLERLDELADKHCEEAYYRVRDDFNEGLEGARLAAAFIYLNKTGFNGLYRENLRGGFNVPFGHRPFVPERKSLRSAARCLRRAELRVGDFTLVAPASNDVVYCDPPYHNTFTSYSSGGFGETDQIRLRDACLEWAEKGATVIVSNSLNPFTTELYRNFTIRKVEAPRPINRNGKGRKPVLEILAILRP